MATELTTTLRAPSLHVFASTPDEMGKAQQALIEWCAAKIKEVTLERTDAVTNRDNAKRHKWAHEPWQRRVRQAQHKIDFYKKIMKALEAGYYIVPPFPQVDLFAVRTKRRRPPPGRGTTNADWVSPISGEVLPEGEGDYVSPRTVLEDHGNMATDPDSGEQKWRANWLRSAHMPIEFPFTLVKPEVIEATTRAMRLQAFDRLGVLPEVSRRRDPIVVGQIIPKHKGAYADPVTFFVTWWLNTDDL